MGYDCEINVIKRIDGVSDEQAVSAIVYASIKAFRDSVYKDEQCDDEISDANLILPNKEILDKYIQYYNGNLKRGFSFWNDWGSGGRGLSEHFSKYKTPSKTIGYNSYPLTQEDILDVEKSVDAWLDERQLEPVSVSYCYKINDNDSVIRDVTYQDTITLFPVDGIECRFGDDTIKRIDSLNIEYAGLYASKKHMDCDDYFAHKCLKEKLEKLKNFDPKEYVVYFEESY